MEQSTSLGTNLLETLVEVHLSVGKASNEYLTQMGRYNYSKAFPSYNLRSNTF